MVDDEKQLDGPEPGAPPAIHGKDGNSGPLTRRQWFMRLGETAILVGFRGMVGEGLTGMVLATPPAEEVVPPSPPPGLYEPSEDHMTHALTADDRFHPIPPGSETDFIAAHSGPFQPQFFSPPQLKVVERLAELVLGKETSQAATTDQTDNQRASAEIAEWIDTVVFNSEAVREAARKLSPQHRALATAYYGSDAARRLETEDTQRTWPEGLDWLAEESTRRYRQAFLDLREAEQVELLKSISDDRPDKTLNHAGTRLFALLKTQVIRGYYTSQPGLRELDYKGNTFYVECPGCEGREHS
jgi:hypothetical protein